MDNHKIRSLLNTYSLRSVYYSLAARRTIAAAKSNPWGIGIFMSDITSIYNIRPTLECSCNSFENIPTHVIKAISRDVRTKVKPSESYEKITDDLINAAISYKKQALAVYDRYINV